MPKIHPALKTAPKSLRESLERIAAHIKSGKAIRHLYKDGDCRCSIGIFFTDDQMKKIMKARNKAGTPMNSLDVRTLAKRFGQQNIEAMTGMSLLQAETIQGANDTDPQNLLQWIEVTLTKGEGNIGRNIGRVQFTL